MKNPIMMRASLPDNFATVDTRNLKEWYVDEFSEKVIPNKSKDEKSAYFMNRYIRLRRETEADWWLERMAKGEIADIVKWKNELQEKA